MATFQLLPGDLIAAKSSQTLKEQLLELSSTPRFSTGTTDESVNGLTIQQLQKKNQTQAYTPLKSFIC